MSTLLQIVRRRSPRAALSASRSTGSVAARLCVTGLLPLACLVARPGAAVAAEQRLSGFQLTPDGRRILISKDVDGGAGTERWAITHHLDDESVTGNVYPPDGGSPHFVSCSRVAADTLEVTLACSGANPCVRAPCPAEQWIALGTVRVPLSFLEPPELRDAVRELPDGDPLRDTPETIVIDGRTLAVELADLWRDYLSGGDSLMAVIRVVTLDGSPFPARVTIDRLFVINEMLVWEAAPVVDPSSRPSPPRSASEAFFTGGPQWGPTLTDSTPVVVTPVVWLRRGREAWLLRGAPVRIHITV